MSEHPRISIIIPTCRRPQLLFECIESILNNDLTDFEILVVDQDPSQTLRSALADKFNRDDRISYLFLAEAALDKLVMWVSHMRVERSLCLWMTILK